ncbi:MAG: helix-turn-helix domain-containing protein [Proteobacteria bacterium]|nr:helix-turn-helix domain-containing protein [Pseudomonadota bacterium]
MTLAGIPHFQLYGEGASFADPGFVHIETIASRSSLTGWEIRPHQHDTLDQLLIIRAGGLAITIEGVTEQFQGPVAIHVPAGMIHGFAFDEGVDGAVITFSVDLRAMLAAAQSAPTILPRRPIAQRLSQTEAARLGTLVENLHVECSGHAPGRIIAAGWLVGLLLVHLARAIQDTSLPISADNERARQFRALVDRHFAEHRPIAFYARSLGMTERSLTRFARAHFGSAPMQYIHRRMLLEARRLLVYGGQPVARVAEELGFSDPSYFSRFYHRMAKERPSSRR